MDTYYSLTNKKYVHCSFRNRNYCTSKGNNQAYEYIQSVEHYKNNFFHQLFSHQSGASGYSDFTGKNISFTKGQWTALTLRPAYPQGGDFDEFWKIWIDYNQDGDFDDEYEDAFGYDNVPRSGPVEISWTLPDNALEGKSCMRVQMSYDPYMGPCDDFTYGEVEDYSILVYCESEGENSSEEWIAGVQVGNFTNNSGAAGYTDFTYKSIELEQGKCPIITLTPGFSGTNYSERWKIWIDYNQDGDFNDYEEQVFASNRSSEPVQGGFCLPSNAHLGKTRMRVMMKYWYLPNDPCETFNYGEVEDYSVFIVNSAPKARFTFNEQECVDGGCTNVGSPAYVADQTGGYALRCDGQSYIAYPDAPAYQMGTGDLSISCWVRTSNYCWPPKSVLDKRYFPTGIGYHLCVVRNSEVLIQLADNTGWSNYNRNSGITLTDNQWHHIVVTVDRDNPDGIRYYVDGELKANGNPMDRQGSLDNQNDLLLGGQNDTQEAYFVGDIDNVRLYDKVISEDIISNLYNSKL